MKFNLTVNNQQFDGFKLTVQADTEAELLLAQELTNKLIEKITKIEVSVKSYEE